jgi:ATP-binding cassette subfamily B protein
VSFISILFIYLEKFDFDLKEFGEDEAANFVFANSLFDLLLLGLVPFLVLAMLIAFMKTTPLGYGSKQHVSAACTLLFRYSCFIAGFLLVKIATFQSSAQVYITVLILESVVAMLNVPWLWYLSDNINPKAALEETEFGDNKKTLTTMEFFSVLRPYFLPAGTLNRFRSIMTWVLVGASKGTSLISILYIGFAVEDLEAGNQSGAIRNILTYCGLTFFAKATKELQNYVYLRVKQVAFIQIASNTFRHLHCLSLDWHLNKKMGSAIRSIERGIQSANTVVTYLFLYMLPALAECFLVCVLFMLYFDAPALAVTAFTGLLVYIIVTVKVTLWRKKFRQRMNKYDNDMQAQATDSLINYETVKYFTNEQFESDRYSKSVVQYQENSTVTQESLNILNLLQQFIIYVTLASGLYLAAIDVINGDANTGEFVSVNLYIVQLFTPLSFLGTVYNSVITAFIDMRNLGQLLAEKPEIVDRPNARELVVDKSKSGGNMGVNVEFRGVKFHYPTQPPQNGLQGVSFSMKSGQTVAVVGHTGAGKTTLSRLLFRFYDAHEGHSPAPFAVFPIFSACLLSLHFAIKFPLFNLDFIPLLIPFFIFPIFLVLRFHRYPFKGSISINGEDVLQVKQTSLRENIGIVPQDAVMFNNSILYNIQYGRLGASFKEVEDVCRSAQILDFIEGLPEGFDTMVGERGLKLSGGEKQRVAIARCLLKNPPLVILDEATSALDTITEKSVQDALSSLSQNRTVLVIAHRLSTVQNADSIIVLDKGSIVEQGTHEELVAIGSGGVYHGLWKMQLKTDSSLPAVEVDRSELE